MSDILFHKKEIKVKKKTLFGHFDQKQKCSVFTFVQYIYIFLNSVVDKCHHSIHIYLIFKKKKKKSKMWYTGEVSYPFVRDHGWTSRRVLTHYHTIPHLAQSRYIAVENIVRKGEIACNKQFLLFSQCFPAFMVFIFHFKCT